MTDQDTINIACNERNLIKQLVVSSKQKKLSLISTIATHYPDVIAFCFLEQNGLKRFISYGELNKKIESIAAILQSKFKPGERALLIFHPGFDFIASFLACLSAKIIAIPAYPQSNNKSQEKLQKIINNAEPTLIISTTELLQFSPKHLAQINVDKLGNNGTFRLLDIGYDYPAFLQYTSGTTGEPKGVIITHGNLFNNMILIGNAFDTDRTELSQRDRFCVSWLPPYHDMGLIGSILTPLFGGFLSILMHPLTVLLNPFQWLKTISDYKADISGGPLFAYEYCINKITDEQKRHLDLSCWGLAFSGAGPLYLETFERFYQAFKNCGFKKNAFFSCYGLAESTLCVSHGLRDDGITSKPFSVKKLYLNQVMLNDELSLSSIRHLVSSGKPVQNVKIVNPTTCQLCQSSEVGEIWISGSSVGKGYWNNERATKNNFQANIADDASKLNYLRTGDLGFLWDGELYVTGRLNDVILIDDKIYYPHDIERTIEKSNASIQSEGCAAFTLTTNGKESLAIICEVNKSSLDFEELRYIISDAVFYHHELAIHHLLFISPHTLPKTTSGKKKRFECRALSLENSNSSLYLWKS